VRSARLFDIYRPAAPSAEIATGERSLAVRLELLDDEITLTDDRIDSTVATVLKALNERLGVRLRG
jgi:phenylalanyl-tRNA synthetase beta chain